MQKFTKLFAATIAFCSGIAFAAVEGTDYVVLETPIANAEGTLIKVFSYDCPFCFKYAKAVDKAVAAKTTDFNFTPFHLKTKGRYGIQGSTLLAAALVKDENEGLKPLDPKSNFHKVEMALYQAYHVKKMRWDGGKNPDAFIQTGLDALGWNRADYDTMAKNPKVQNLIKQWDAGYSVAKIQGVPAYVVNGKYLLMTKNIKSIDSMAETIRELGKK